MRIMRPEESSVRAALSVIAGRWKPLIVFYLLEGAKRFGELHKAIPEAAESVLSQQLRELEPARQWNVAGSR